MIYGIGIDIVDVRKFKSAIERRGSRLSRRLFTDGELSYCLGKRFPERHLAARFACKVSLFKALGRRLRFRDVEVSRDQSGRPLVKVNGPGLEGLSFSVSITHDSGYSVAETIVERVTTDEARR